MNTVKRIFLSLVVVLMTAAAPLSAMKADSERLATEQSVASTCAQSFWNTLSAVKNAAYYSVKFVAPEAGCLPDMINDMLLHMALRHDDEEVKDQSGVVKPKNSDSPTIDGTLTYSVCALLSGIKNKAIDGVSYAHTMVTNGAIYAHDAINGAITHITVDDE
jgi:hypothetical protein